jgi:hypothetical protein
MQIQDGDSLIQAGDSLQAARVIRGLQVACTSSTGGQHLSGPSDPAPSGAPNGTDAPNGSWIWPAGTLLRSSSSDLFFTHAGGTRAGSGGRVDPGARRPQQLVDLAVVARGGLAVVVAQVMVVSSVQIQTLQQAAATV